MQSTISMNITIWGSQILLSEDLDNNCIDVVTAVSELALDLQDKFNLTLWHDKSLVKVSLCYRYDTNIHDLDEKNHRADYNYYILRTKYQKQLGD